MTRPKAYDIFHAAVAPDGTIHYAGNRNTAAAQKTLVTRQNKSGYYKKLWTYQEFVLVPKYKWEELTTPEYIKKYRQDK